MAYSDDKTTGFLQCFASAMIRSRRGVLREYATLLRFSQGTKRRPKGRGIKPLAR